MDAYSPLTLLAAFVLGTVAVGRAARLVTHDAYPPMQWLRLRWLTWAGQTERREGWGPLLTCPFCCAPYLAAGNLAWALTAGLEWGPFWSSAWWVVNAWAAVSYLAAILVVRDEPAEED